MKLIDAVYEVLKDSAAPMGAEEIERAILSDQHLQGGRGLQMLVGKNGAREK